MTTKTLDERLRDLLGPQITEAELLEKFTFEREIGSGATAKVYAAFDHRTGERVAIKEFDKAQMIEVRKSIMGDAYASRDTAVTRVQRRLKKVIMELEIAKSLAHKHIIRYLGGFETSHRICIIHELVDGRDLLEYVLSFQKMEETTAAHVFDQMLRAVHACHGQDIWHRDLKLENVLISHDYDVKLIDFGLSERTSEKLRTVCGTPLYCSPELLFLPTNTRDIGIDGAPADVWSAAILLFALLTGCAPFDDSSFAALRHDVYRNDICYPSHLSESVQDLFRTILVSDPDARPTIPDILEHPWVVENAARHRAKSSAAQLRGLHSVSTTSETEDSSDEDGSYRDMLYDEAADEDDAITLTPSSSSKSLHVDRLHSVG
ncbi:Aste57867_251 [Aphanomyces stellatus]|uniref:Aste57867_251 protein n=1 Tax=Aphanomyces stellatus TaxID=120398 RepID=A0A485K247_9STRA|nr:hypothetical protein As57867_000251 [Aphanomyces stellatus]VFT77477.1 Aste57867_251 [Aphanomyces stellatus]